MITMFIKYIISESSTILCKEEDVPLQEKGNCAKWTTSLIKAHSKCVSLLQNARDLVGLNSAQDTVGIENS